MPRYSDLETNRFLTLLMICMLLVFSLGVALAGDGERVLVDAVIRGDLTKVQSLLDSGTSPNTKPDGHLSALGCAVEGGHKEIARLLVDRGADVNLTDSFGMTPLMSATLLGEMEFVQILLAKGPHLNVRDNYDGSTALSNCSIMGISK